MFWVLFFVVPPSSMLTLSKERDVVLFPFTERELNGSLGGEYSMYANSRGLERRFVMLEIEIGPSRSAAA